MFIAQIVIVLTSVLVVASTAAAARGWFRINPLVGIRYRYFVTSERAWRAGHCAAFVPVATGGVLFASAAIVSWVAPVASNQAVIILLVGAGLMLAALAIGVWRGNVAALNALAQG